MKKDKKIKLVIITGNALRHYWFVEYLSKKFNVVGIIFEKRKNPVTKKSRTSHTDSYIKERDKKEKEYFGNDYTELLSRHNVLNLERGEASSSKTLEWIKEMNPHFVILYGSSIIQDPVLSYYKGKMINMHLGLSPYYRGSATNFWPFVNGEPECVGATIHLAVSEVDAGGILAQVRPEIKKGDDIHDIGFKTIIAGAETMVKAITKYFNNELIPHRQDEEALLRGKLYKRADFNVQAIKKMEKNFQINLVENYLAGKQNRDKRYPLIQI